MRFIFTRICFLLLCVQTANIRAQSKQAEYERAVLKEIQEGTFQGFDCGHSHRSFPTQSSQRACAELNQGYGTNGWLPASNNGHARGAGFDINCTVPPTSVPACGKFKIPVAITVFENPAFVGTNYLGGSGFAALPDADINNALANMNMYYANANMEFYEAVPRRRLTNPDMYDFYTPFLGSNDISTGGNDGVDDDPQTAAFDRANIINIYFVGGLDGVHGASGTTGYAPLPDSRDYTIMAYRALFGTTLYHELGHYFGLFHTHNNTTTGTDNAQYPPDGAMNNSDCLTKGDQICDTWPDPNFTGCRNATCVYQTTPAPPCGVLTINPASGTNYGGGVSSILQHNIMTYNSFGSCRQNFSPCQYFKVNDVLKSCRANLCDTSVARHFNSIVLNNPQSPYKELCAGSAIPTFTAKSNCYNWYLVPTGGAPVATATNTFTPTPAQLDMNLAGTTFFYIEESNFYNVACRQKVSVTVLAKPGTGTDRSNGTSTVLLTGSGAETVTAGATGAVLGTNQLVGWWLTPNNPISTSVTNSAQLSTALSTAIINGTVNTSTPNHIFESAIGSPFTGLDLPINCANLDPARDYFLTPFVASKKAVVPDVSCPVNKVGTATTFSGNAAKVTTIANTDVSCRPANPPNAPTFSLRITVSGYTGGAGTLSLRVRSTCAGASIITQNNLAGNGTYILTQADFPVGYDPGVSGFCVFVFQNPGAGMSAGTLNTRLDITYPGTPAIPFPSAVYTNCLFGAPVQINCPNNTPVSTGVGCYSGTQAGVAGTAWFNILDGGGRLIGAINPNGNNLGTVTISVNDMSSVPVDGDGHFYLPRYWNLESSNFGGTAQIFPAGAVGVRLYFLDTELSAYNTANGTGLTASQLNLSHYAGVNEDCDILNNNYNTASLEFINAGLIATNAYSSTSGAGYQSQFTLTHFSEVGLSGAAVMLAENPILNFSAKVANKGVRTAWELKQGSAGIATMLVERGFNGQDFVQIGELAFSPNQTRYELLDLYPVQGGNYYRLRVKTKTDGEFLSGIEYVHFQSNEDMNILPNPVGEQATLVYFSAQIAQADEIRVLDATGKLVFTQLVDSQQGMNYKQISTQKLATGVYTLQLRQAAQTRTLRFIR